MAPGAQGAVELGDASLGREVLEHAEVRVVGNLHGRASLAGLHSVGQGAADVENVRPIQIRPAVPLRPVAMGHQGRRPVVGIPPRCLVVREDAEVDERVQHLSKPHRLNATFLAQHGGWQWAMDIKLVGDVGVNGGPKGLGQEIPCGVAVSRTLLVASPSPLYSGRLTKKAIRQQRDGWDQYHLKLLEPVDHVRTQLHQGRVGQLVWIVQLILEHLGDLG